ncbi:hypothetical protein HMPREF1548_02244 [Clostridium sp. KLE 1755]|nr:hypothetical protein HMPREF1548_02244 [Clostridium sp. KLE 1755]
MMIPFFSFIFFFSFPHAVSFICFPIQHDIRNFYIIPAFMDGLQYQI